MNKAPEIKINYDPDYAQLIGGNFDTLQECANVEAMPPNLAKALEAGKNEALEKHEGQGTEFIFGGETFQVWSSGSRGNKWVIEDDTLQYHFRTDKPGWNVTIRYKAAGLWQYGVDKMRARAIELLRMEMVVKGEDFLRVSRVDYAFDFYSPKFSPEMRGAKIRNKLVLTSGVKYGLVGTAHKDETLTIGVSKNSAIQIQVYNKGQELRDKPGKEWMFEVWERHGYVVNPGEQPGDHCWRVEVRFKNDFLKECGILTFEKFRENIMDLLSEAILRRRVCIPEETKHRERWGLHPLWSAVWFEAGMSDQFVPKGKVITQARAEYREMMKKQLAGLQRVLSVLDHQRWSDIAALKHSEHAVEVAKQDPRHRDKIDRCIERQRFIDDAA